jgi:septal ring factor EnvC (AmiA/AmiB activator)
MSKLEDASARLDQALDRLDEVLGKAPRKKLEERIGMLEESLSTTGSERDRLRAELAALKADQQKLGGALRDSQENYAAMQVVNEAVAGRLDDAIGSLKALLGD